MSDNHKWNLKEPVKNIDLLNLVSWFLKYAKVELREKIPSTSRLTRFLWSKSNFVKEISTFVNDFANLKMKYQHRDHIHSV